MTNDSSVFDTNNVVHFFYKGQWLGDCDVETTAYTYYASMECPKLLELMKTDRTLATDVLDYLNSLGDPLFPKAGTDYEDETDVDNVDIDELYDVLMQELGYEYMDYLADEQYDFNANIGGLEVFVGEVADGAVYGSTKPKYFADMVSASYGPESEDGYEYLVEDDDDDYKYYVAGYFDENCRGVDDNLNSGDFDAILDKAHELACAGDYVEIKNLVNGKSHYYTSDQWMEAIEMGDVPSSVYDLV